MSSLYIENYVSGVRLTGGIKTKKPVTLSGTSATLSVGGTLTVTGATSLTGAQTITSTSASALAVGANGATNPVLKVNASTASVATGISITGAAAAAGAAIAVISSGTDENLTIDAKGSGTITLGNTSSGNIVFARAATGQALSVTGALTAISATATPAAASAVAAVKWGTANIGIYWGTGSPNTALTAAKGSLYICTDGSSSSTRMYVNTDGSTAWTSFTTAA